MVSPAKHFSRTPDTFTFLFPLINLTPEQILTLFSLQNRNAFRQEIFPPTAICYSVLQDFMGFIMFAYSSLICVKFSSFISSTSVQLLILLAGFMNNLDLYIWGFYQKI